MKFKRFFIVSIFLFSFFLFVSSCGLNTNNENSSSEVTSTKSEITTISRTSTSTSDVSASSETKYYSVTFNDTESGKLSFRVEENKAFTAIPTPKEKIGYIGSYEYDFSCITSNMDCYPTYAYITYTITYELDGGYNEVSNPQTYTVADSFKLNDPVKGGFTFCGWYLENTYQTKVTSILAGTTGNLTLYAKFEI